MLLSESVTLLGEHGKHFSDVYKLYEYSDDQLLKDYLDFVIHEPVEWMRGFPSKLINKGSFSKPKTALIKLLKQTAVVDALGEIYVKNVHDIVWSTFKKHSEEIIAKRQKSVAVSVLDQLDAESVESHERQERQEGQEVLIEDLDDIASIHSVRLPARRSAAPAIPVVPVVPSANENEWKKRYRALELAYRELIDDVSVSYPGFARSTLILLDALSDSS